MRDGARREGRAALTSEIELLENIEIVFYTAVLADALDELGQRDRAMREYLRPLAPEMKFAGYAQRRCN